MFNHEPADYRCPFCAVVAGDETAVNHRSDVVARRPLATALISPRWWPNNPGHALVVPNRHVENLYDLPAELGHAVHDLVRDVAVAMRATYDCAGTSTRQHNEPAGNQDVWHHHVHVFPRYVGDELYGSRPEREFVAVERRRPYAGRLRRRLEPGATRARRQGAG